jgi:hypothetical protein
MASTLTPLLLLLLVLHACHSHVLPWQRSALFDIYRAAGCGASECRRFSDTDECPESPRLHCDSDGYVTHLDMGALGLTGSLATELGRLQRLTFLKAFDNFLASTLPSEIGRLELLRDLSFRNNSLHGTVPQQWQRLTSLSFLFLFDNNLSGTVNIAGEWGFNGDSFTAGAGGATCLLQWHNSTSERNCFDCSRVPEKCFCTTCTSAVAVTNAKNTTATATPTNNSNASGTSTALLAAAPSDAALVGAVVGGTAAFLLVIGAIATWVCVLRRRKVSQSRSPSASVESPSQSQYQQIPRPSEIAHISVNEYDVVPSIQN